MDPSDLISYNATIEIELTHPLVYLKGCVGLLFEVDSNMNYNYEELLDIADDIFMEEYKDIFDDFPDMITYDILYIEKEN